MQNDARTALLTVRAWCEEGSSHPTRVQIRTTGDVTTGLGPTMTFIEEAAVMAAVHEFLVAVRCGPITGESVTPASHRGHS
jgi:hypothetical protein